MDEVLRNAADIAKQDAVSKALQDLHGSIVSLAKKLQDVGSKDEIDVMVRNSSINTGSGLKRGTIEECIESLKQIYSDFLQMEDSVLKGLEQRGRTAKQVIQGEQPNMDNMSERITQKLSLASGFSTNQQELQEKLESFYDNIRGFEERMKQHKLDEERGDSKRDGRVSSSPTSVYSGLSNLQSAFGDQSVHGEPDRKRMSDFMANLDKLQGALEKGPMLQSGELSEFTNDINIQLKPTDGDDDRDGALASPTKSSKSLMSDMSVQAFNENENLNMKQVLDRMYGQMGNIKEILIHEKEPLQSIQASAFHSVAGESPTHNNEKPDDLHAKLDFKK